MGGRVVGGGRGSTVTGPHRKGAPLSLFSPLDPPSPPPRRPGAFPIPSTKIVHPSSGAASPASAGAVPAPTVEELTDVSLACARLWELDEHRLTPGVHYVINLQGAGSIEAAALPPPPPPLCRL